MLGELGLDGRVRPVRGVLPATLAAEQAGFRRVIVPLRQAGEASLVEGVEVFGVGSVAQLVAFLRGEPVPEVEPIEVAGEPVGTHATRQLDLADVVGQLEAKWACEVAAAGRHHMLFHGPPGVGKTMLAERVPALLPDLDVHDALEVSAVHSLAGFNLADRLITRPPYSDPHHSASVASIVGGGQRMAKPGAISLRAPGCALPRRGAGVLPGVIEALRTPLESGTITLGRSEVHARYPARFQLVLAANPCPCGQAATPGARCQCPPMVIRRYAEKISRPIRDRIDINQAFLPMRKAYLKAALQRGESSAVVAGRVAEARDRQASAAGRHRVQDQQRGLGSGSAPPAAAAGRLVGGRRGGGPGPAECPRRRQGPPVGLDRRRSRRVGTFRVGTTWRWRWPCGGGEQPGTVRSGPGESGRAQSGTVPLGAGA